MRRILTILWQLPQFLLLILVFPVLLIGYRKTGYVRGVPIYTPRRWSYQWLSSFGFQLGWAIFAWDIYDKKLISHELGHRIQSAIIGPFMILTIYIPSVIWFLIYNIKLKFYHGRYTEFSKGYSKLSYDLPLFELTASQLGLIWMNGEFVLGIDKVALYSFRASDYNMGGSLIHDF